MENRLEEIRKARGIKQEDLALELGVSRQTISSLEKGRYNPSILLALNRKSAVLTLSIGIACAIVAVALALDLGGISSVLPIAAKGVWGFAGCAAALLVCGAFALAHKPTPQQIIEQGDERNAAINGKAGLCAFEAFSMLAPLAALALYAFEQISTAGVLTIIAVEVVASIVYFAQIARMQRIM